MNLKAIAEYLETKRIGRVGEVVFITEMPMEAKEGVLLLNRYSGSEIDHELPGWRDTGFRMVTRSADYERGEALAERISEVLTINGDTEMGRGKALITMRKMLPVNDPLPYRRSEGGYWEFEVDVECVYIKS
jgi:hypothetical protein